METKVSEQERLSRTGWRIPPEIHSGVRAGAAYAGLTVEKYVAEVLGEHLVARGLMPRNKGKETR